MFDLRRDIGPGEARGGVLQAVGKDRDDDLRRPILLRDRREVISEFVDRSTDRVEERGAVARNVGVAIQRENLGDRQGMRRHEILVVKKDKGEFRQALGLLLFPQETIEPLDGCLLAALHGSGPVEDESNFGVIFVHGENSNTRGRTMAVLLEYLLLLSSHA